MTRSGHAVRLSDHGPEGVDQTSGERLILGDFGMGFDRHMPAQSMLQDGPACVTDRVVVLALAACAQPVIGFKMIRHDGLLSG